MRAQSAGFHLFGPFCLVSRLDGNKITIVKIIIASHSGNVADFRAENLHKKRFIVIKFNGL